MLLVVRLVKYGVFFALFIGLMTLGVVYYPWIFSKSVVGEIVEVERLTTPNAILGRTTESQIHSYAILIQHKDGQLYSSSSEDRQWQIAKKGYCAEALYYRYPPWELDKANTFFNARLKRIYRCPGSPILPNSEVDASQESSPAE